MNLTLQRTIFVVLGVAVVVLAAFGERLGMNGTGQALLGGIGGGLLGKEFFPQSKAAP